MKILITGGCGFVGRRFVRRLAEQEHKVTVIDNLSSGVHPDAWLYPAKGAVQYHFADVRNALRGLNPSPFDLVIHCAAIVGGRLTIENDPLAVATDLSIDAEMFNWIVRGERKPHLIYFSSSAVYPLEVQTEHNNALLHESLVTFGTSRFAKPDMTYGFAKLAGEYLATFAVEKYGLPVTVYRPFSGYGEDQALSYPFPAIIQRIIDGENPVTVWGSGNQLRDWVHIEDVVDAVLATWEIGGTWNIGSGQGTSFFALASLMREVLGKDFEIKPDLDKPEGVFARVADTYNIGHYWEPRIRLDDGIGRVAAALLTRRDRGV